MRILALLLLMLFSGLPSQAQHPTPRQLLPGLFDAVQLSRIFPDNKTFVDAVPRQPPAVILASWQQQRTQPGFQLKEFVERHFQLPAATAVTYHSDPSKGIRHHLDTLWKVLERPATAARGDYSSLLPLPKPYLVPGGRFREVYYWDSYFTMLGLRQAGRTALMRSMLDNFAYQINNYGFIPNGNRTYYLTRSQPPFFSLMVELLAQTQGDTVLRHYQQPLLREYAYWMAGADSVKPGSANKRVVRLPTGEVLNRYWDSSSEPREESYAEDVLAAQTSTQPSAIFHQNIRAAAASGWDFSTRWFGPSGTLGSIRTTSLVPVDLNCLLMALESTIARSYSVRQQPTEASKWQQRVKRRQDAIQRYCWNDSQGWFFDYDWQLRQPSSVRTIAGVFPLTFGLATSSQAQRVAASIQANFLRAGGVLTTLATSGQQWDAPNGWAPLQYLTIQGLRRYRHTLLADTIQQRWIKLNLRVFQQTGKLLEKYNVVDTTLLAGGGEYPLQDGFGWTNGVLLYLLDHPVDVKPQNQRKAPRTKK